jgi:hypothetical protein
MCWTLDFTRLVKTYAILSLNARKFFFLLLLLLLFFFFIYLFLLFLDSC